MQLSKKDCRTLRLLYLNLVELTSHLEAGVLHDAFRVQAELLLIFVARAERASRHLPVLKQSPERTLLQED